MRKETLLGIIIGLVIVVGAGVIFFASKRLTKSLPKAKAPSETQAPAAQAPQKPQLKVSHFFVNGEHTYRGVIDLPTPCFRITPAQKVTQSASGKDKAEIDINVSEDASAGPCAQVITSRDFTVSFKASEDAEIVARVNGQEVEFIVEQANINFFNGQKDGFTFSYPIDWNKEEPQAQFTDITFKDQGTTTLRILVTPKSVVKRILGLKNVKKDKIIIEAVNADYTIGQTRDGGANIFINNFFSNGRYFTLEYSTKLAPENADIELKKILQGFKLVDAGILYFNDEDDFALALPLKWDGYSVEKTLTGGVKKYGFLLASAVPVAVSTGMATTTKNSFSPVSILVYSKNKWEEKSKKELKDEEKIGEKGNKVFSFFAADLSFAPVEFLDRVTPAAIFSIKNSFKIISE